MSEQASPPHAARGERHGASRPRRAGGFNAFETLKEVVTLYWRGVNGHCDKLHVDFRNGRAYPVAYIRASGRFEPDIETPRGGRR